jgi:hypothetical protein
MLKRLLGLNDDERQNLTTLSMMFGTMALTVVLAGMTWLQRFGWSHEVIVQNAPALIDGFFNLSFGVLGLMGIMIVAQAVIAIGGKLKGALGPASFEAEAEHHDPQ